MDEDAEACTNADADSANDSSATSLSSQPPATIAQASEPLGSELPDDPSAVQSSQATTGSPSSPKKGKPRSPQISESSSLSPQLRRMLRKASPSPRKTKQAIPDDQELERRSQVRGLMHLWNKCDFRYEDLLRLRKLRLSNRALDDDDIGALCAVLDEKMKREAGVLTT